MPETWSTVRATSRSAWTVRSAGMTRAARATATTSMTAAPPTTAPTTGNNSGSETNENGGEKIESVSTGDESAVGFWSLMAVIMVSIVMCMAFTKIRRKKQRN